jgi:hypothetical protein
MAKVCPNFNVEKITIGSFLSAWVKVLCYTGMILRIIHQFILQFYPVFVVNMLIAKIEIIHIF